MDPLSDPSGDHQNRGPAFLSVSITFCVLAFVSVLLRLYTRLTIVHLIGMDDLAVFLAMVSLLRLLYRSISSPDRHCQFSQQYPTGYALRLALVDMSMSFRFLN